MNLFQIKAPHFVAGFCLDARNVVWEAASVIKWFKGKPLGFVVSYCKSKGWEINAVID